MVNQKAVVHLEIVKGDHTFIFTMPIGSPFGEAYDACFEALKTISEMSAQAVENAKPKTMSQEELQDAINKAN